MDKVIKNIKDKAIIASTNNKKKVFFFVWYSGHGAMSDFLTQVVTNEPDVNKRLFPLEQRLSLIASKKNTYVFACFDCCRTPFETFHRERSVILDYALKG